MKMPKFVVISSETVYYETEVEAENVEDARARFFDTVNDSDCLIAFDGDHFEVLEIREENENA
jgi:hypothetical protein